MATELMIYTATKIINDIRNNVLLSNMLVSEISSVPMIDLLREHITENDMAYLKTYLQANDNALIQFGIALFQNIKNSPMIKSELLSLWERSKTYEEKMNVMFRILDYPDLSVDIHNSIFGFTENNWERWIEECIKWQAGGDVNNLLDSMKRRLKDTRFPLSKAWVYLLIATACPDKTGCQKLIEEYRGKGIPNYEKIVEKLNS